MRGGRAEKKRGGQEAQALGRSRGGFSTKIHLAVDALGNPLRFILTGGECHESPQAGALVEGYSMQVLIGDKGYDSADFIKELIAAGVEAVIPPRVNRLELREYDKHLYRERHLVECSINKVKQYRRVFSRFEKLSKNYLGLLSFVSALVWLR